jgi:hypothetical protein
MYQVFFCDGDTWINPLQFHTPLSILLEKVPADKVVVMGNYFAMTSGVMPIRNNAVGRAVVMDWIAVVMSGLIQCHGFDQGALQLLMLATVVAAKTVTRKMTTEEASIKSIAPNTGAAGGSGYSALYSEARPMGFQCEWMPNFVKDWKGKMSIKEIQTSWEVR